MYTVDEKGLRNSQLALQVPTATDVHDVINCVSKAGVQMNGYSSGYGWGVEEAYLYSSRAKSNSRSQSHLIRHAGFVTTSDLHTDFPTDLITNIRDF